MLRHNPRKTAQINAAFQVPDIKVRNARRVTLAGPFQLLNKPSVLPVVMLDTSKKADLLNAPKSPAKTMAKKTGSKHSPKAAKTAMSPSPKKGLSPRRSQRVSSLKLSPKHASPEQPKLVSPKIKKVVKPSPKSKKLSPPRKSRRTANVKSSPKHSSPKRKKSVSPKSTQKAKASPKAEKVPAFRSSRRTANVKVSPTRSPPKQKTSRKSTQESPAGTRHLRSAAPISSPKPLNQEKAETLSTVSRKRKRSVSPASAKKPNISALSEKQSKSPVARASKVETFLKPAEKRKRDAVSLDEDESKLSLPPKKKVLKGESKSAAKKTSKKVIDKSFTEVKMKSVTGNAAKLEGNDISATQQHSTPLKPKLSADDVSMNWSMSNIKRKLLASITPSRMKENKQTPISINARPIKSALFSAKKNEGGSPEKRTTRSQSVRFKINGKAGTVKELKQRSSRKRLCYRVFQYLLLLGLPAAITVASVLVYNGLV